MNDSGPRPNHFVEFERALAQRTRFASMRSSAGGGAERSPSGAPLRPSSKTLEMRTTSREVASVSVRNDRAAPPVPGGGGAVGDSKPAGELSHRKPFKSALKLSSIEKLARERTAPPADPADASPEITRPKRQGEGRG